ncbi:MAG: YqgE/AlgH family protein [Gammaproteobacteria bacterium]|nr:YqgE/AlgH family protein [Gammaproteobacteria bacterium]
MNLTNYFLIATPQLDDTKFARTVVYICQHNDAGAMGFILNARSTFTLGEIMEQLSINGESSSRSHEVVYLGGPVQSENGFVLHRPPGAWKVSLPISKEMGVTTSQDVLSAIAINQGPEEAIVALGYCGWKAGQLEKEIINNDWLTVPADLDLIFHCHHTELWSRALKLLGIQDINQLSQFVGHG